MRSGTRAKSPLASHRARKARWGFIALQPKMAAMPDDDQDYVYAIAL